MPDRPKLGYRQRQQVLDILQDRAGTYVSSRELARRIYGYDGRLSRKSVVEHIRLLRQEYGHEVIRWRPGAFASYAWTPPDYPGGSVER